MRSEAARRDRIVELVQRQGFAAIEALASTFEVTPQTIRRDINELCGEGLLRRYHGGAGLPSSVENLAYPQRQVLHLEEKRRIARAVAAAVPDGASLFIDIGTTTEEVAKALLDHRSLRVITNNLNVAAMLAAKPEFQVICAGGVVRARDLGLVGEATVDLIRQFKVDYGIIGISGIEPDGTMLDFDYQEVRVAQAIMTSSRKVYLATDTSKFGRSALVRMGRIDEVDALFTEAEPPRAIRDLLLAADRQLVIADE